MICSDNSRLQVEREREGERAWGWGEREGGREEETLI